MPTEKARAFVLPIKGRDDDISNLIKAISDAGCSAAHPKGAPGSLQKSLESADVLVILICTQSLSDNAVDQAIEAARRLNKRIVGVWAKDMKEEKHPPGIHKAASAVICFKLHDIKRAICGDENYWLDPSCQSRNPPKTPRHKN